MKFTLSNIKIWLSSNIKDYLILRYFQNGVYPDIEIDDMFNDLLKVLNIEDADMNQELIFKNK